MKNRVLNKPLIAINWDLRQKNRRGQGGDRALSNTTIRRMEG